MAACLMVRDDNALMYEWLAYHYTTLPLRHVLVAADLNSTENPNEVLRVWNGTDLKFVSWTDADFMYRFGEIPVGAEDQNHHYLHRQRAFFTSCAEYMKAQNESWVVFVDTDEFVVINRLNKDDDPFREEEMEKNSTRYQRFQQRAALRSSDTTVMDVIRASMRVAPLDPCHVMPRLLISALENETCFSMNHVKEVIKSDGFDYAQLSSIRFVQTAPKNTFYPSKWGKVMVDVNRLSSESIAKKPKSSHRPFKECPKPLRLFEEAIIHVNHYLGSWERYSARKDVRRSRGAFEERAYFSHGLACEMNLEDWFLQFVETFGVDKAKYLLGHNTT
eukprot:CAMPEP_0178905938 /NCGR_PEP_ID=MMETSP0786-20121207/6553_1 /TAXON_ID=186022 /ORGANISM="Thalassionema frauenfeldii, Strain CCMP 1798" /LENGTH=332 /DNA_ID=CAMNT_0020577601 /DNA_START=262 /DNA_END=1260 /DNA_ORIENTATION=+